MKHHKAMRTLGRERNQRKALLRSLARSLVLRKKIKTTVAKAKEVRPFTEKLVTKAKSATLHDRRLISADIGTEATAKLFKDIAPLYKERKGGYTRITKLGRRLSDGAEMAQIEFV